MSDTNRVIKKYPNRRLYDTAISSYITLDDVRRLIIEGESVQVLDVRSGEDLTRQVLLQKIYLKDASLEVPLALQRMAVTEQFDALIALGAVIRGETYHFEVVSNESARAIMALTLDGLPIGNGILTVENEEQALVRADPARKNKAGEAVAAALAMLDLKQKFG